MGIVFVQLSIAQATGMPFQQNLEVTHIAYGPWSDWLRLAVEAKAEMNVPHIMVTDRAYCGLCFRYDGGYRAD